MPKINKGTLLAGLCPPLDRTLAEQMLDEYVSQEQRFALRDWEPATLDGGQFAEAAARIVYHQDSGNLSQKKSVHNCLKYVEDPDSKNTHGYLDRKSSVHVAKVLRTIYRFRSDRGAVHISPDYLANHLDSKLIVEGVRWVLGEILRVFWQQDRDAVAKAIREIVEYDVPAIGDYDGDILVQRIDCSAEEEVLLLLHFAGELGYSRLELGKFVRKDPAQVTRVIKKLTSPDQRQVIKLGSKNYRLTDLGIKRVVQQLADKLVV